jgi:hypothetical protein
MDAVGVSHCQICQALLNVAWSTCVACQSPVSKRVRQAVPPIRHTGIDWLAAWRKVAALTSGLTADDPRLPIVMAILNECDNAFLRGDWSAFERAAGQVRTAIRR